MGAGQFSASDVAELYASGAAALSLPGSGPGSYTYDPIKVHAVIGVGTATYDYDANGNMTTRGDQTLEWDAMNRLSRVLEGGVPIATFTYDGNGQRIKREEGGETTVYVGKYYEKNLTTGVETFNYYLGNRLVAFERGGELRYLHQDHLTGTSVLTTSTGAVDSDLAYLPWGEVRESSGTVDTDKASRDVKRARAAAPPRSG